MYTYDTIEVGQKYSYQRVLTQEDVNAFAALTGDDNPIHVDAEYARTTRFGQPVVHGVLLLGIVSKVLGRDFPGHGSIAVKLGCKFLRPVPVGSEITVEIQITGKIEKYKHVEGRVYVYTGGKMALAGEATIIPPAGE